MSYVYEKRWSGLDICSVHPRQCVLKIQFAGRGGYGRRRVDAATVREIPDRQLAFQEESTVVVRVELKMVANDQTPAVWCHL